MLNVILFAVCFHVALVEQEWKLVKSDDGVVEALLPGEAKDALEHEDTLAGRVTTKAKEFRTDDVQFTVSSTVLPKLALRFASEKRILTSTKEGMLKKFYGKQTSFKAVKIDGTRAVELKYEAVDFEDEEKKYRGVALMAIKKGTLYTANAIISAESGIEDLKKFRESIRFIK